MWAPHRQHGSVSALFLFGAASRGVDPSVPPPPFRKRSGLRLPPEQPSDDGAWELSRRAVTVVERGRQALCGQRCVVNWAHADHSEPQDPKPVVSREELGSVFTLVVAERIDLGRHLIV